MITIDDVLHYVQQKALNDLNPLFVKRGLKELVFIDCAPDAETSSYECGIYLSSPSGEVYHHDNGYHFVTVSFDAALSTDIKKSNEGQEYLSVVSAWVQKGIGLMTSAETGVTVRVDLGNARNYFAFVMDIAYSTDYDGDSI